MGQFEIIMNPVFYSQFHLFLSFFLFFYAKTRTTDARARGLTCPEVFFILYVQ